MTTRTEIASACGLSAATIANVVGVLINEGLVAEVGSVPSDGGRPSAGLSTRPEGAYMIGAGVGEHGVMVELFDLSMRRIDRIIHDIPAAIGSPEEVARALSSAVREMREQHADLGAGIVGMGLGVPGLIEPYGDGRIRILAQSLGWPPLDVHAFCGVDDLPVYAANGAKTLAMAEQWFGAARGVEHGVVALVGRGVGVGLISDGRLLEGLSGGAGEWGHAKISIGGPECSCGGRGCLEAYVGSSAILARWQERGGDVSGSHDAALARLFDRAGSGDTAAADVLDETVEFLGIGLANLVNLINPVKVIIGGRVGLGLHVARADELAAVVRDNSLVRHAECLTIEACELRGDAVALGAALLPLKQVIEHGLPVEARS
ncbi:ROK family transcriptional regulator [Streptomyces scopuliridis]